MGNIDNAINDLNLVIKHNGKDLIAAEFLLSALKGDAKPTQMPIEYAANLFDDYSDEFESHLIGNLKYQGPQTLYLAVQEFLSKNMVALDIGCGTGLMGKFLKAHTSNLIGIDISQKMLDLAKLKHIYDELILSDANSFLENCKVEFDLVVAVDVFIYIGDLSFTFSRLKNLIRKSGLFCFTVEKMNLGNWSLSPNTLRYSHSRGYVESLSTEHGFKVKVISTNLIRQERGNNVEGYYFVLEKN